MGSARWGLTVAIIVAALFIAAGLRNMFLPGFLSISPGRHGSGWGEIVAGLLILALAAVGWAQQRRSKTDQA